MQKILPVTKTLEYIICISPFFLYTQTNMKMTLLELVQDILSDLDSDEVNSINDSVEALQVAQILKSTYFNIIDGRDWPHLYQPFQLTASGTTDRPTHMRLPDNIIDVSWIKYNCKEYGETRDRVKLITFKTP